jgi:hypothetical protein
MASRASAESDKAATAKVLAATSIKRLRMSIALSLKTNY